MSKYTDLEKAVYNALGVGHKNARSRSELCSLVGCNDRCLREAIEPLRWNYPIITNDDGTGYYIPTADERGRSQAAGWLRRQRRRRDAIAQATRGARLFVTAGKEPGQ